MQTTAIGNKQAFVYLHLSVLLAGFTGLFGKLVTLSEADIVWYRLLFTTLILLVFVGLPRIGWKKILQIGFCGTLLGLHWLLFYGSIKVSNVSIGVLCYALSGFYTSIFEPLILRRKFSWQEMAISLITVSGLLCIFSFDSRYRTGILMGMVSSAVAALFTVFNKRYSDGVSSRTFIMYEMGGGLLGVTCLLPLYLLVFPSAQPVLVVPMGANLWWLLCMALFCTVALYMLQIMALRQLSAFTVNLSFNLEPVYTIVIAFIAFGEARELNASFYVGIALVIFSVLIQTYRSVRNRKAETLLKTPAKSS